MHEKHFTDRLARGRRGDASHFFNAKGSGPMRKMLLFLCVVFGMMAMLPVQAAWADIEIWKDGSVCSPDPCEVTLVEPATGAKSLSFVVKKKEPGVERVRLARIVGTVNMYGSIKITGYDLPSGGVDFIPENYQVDSEEGITITITSLDDTEFKNNTETIKFKLKPTSPSSSWEKFIKIKIDDTADKKSGTVGFTQSELRVSEDRTEPIEIESLIERTGGTDGAIEVKVTVTGGTANSDDYSATTPLEFNFADGSDTATPSPSPTIEIIDDFKSEDPPETITLKMEKISDNGTLGTEKMTIYIHDDNDSGWIDFDANGDGNPEDSGNNNGYDLAKFDVFEELEGNSGETTTVTVYISREVAEGKISVDVWTIDDTNEDLNVNFSDSSDPHVKDSSVKTTAEPNVDYESIRRTEDFLDGEKTIAIPITILGDKENELSEFIGLAVKFVGDGTDHPDSSPPSSPPSFPVKNREYIKCGMVKIVDDDFDTPTFFISPTETSVVEGEKGTVTVNYSGPGPASVEYTITNDTAGGDEYQNTPNVPVELEFAVGESEKTIEIITQKDDDDKDEAIKITLSNPGTGASTDPDQNTCTFTIKEKASTPTPGPSPGPSPSPTPTTPSNVFFRHAEWVVKETRDFLRVTVVREEGLGNTVSVKCTTSGGTATPDSDYNNVSKTLSFTSYQKEATVDIPILDDSIKEGDETFTITLEKVRGKVNITSPDSATVTIRDDESGSSSSDDSAHAYFPHIASGMSGWETEIALVNTSNEVMTGKLNAYSKTGDLLSSVNVNLQQNARDEITIGAQFGSPDQIGNIAFVADDGSHANWTGYTKFFINGKQRVAIPTPTEPASGDLYLSHIAIENGWFTGISLNNTTAQTKTLTVEFNNGERKTLTLAPNANRVYDIKNDLFGGQERSDIQSAVIRNAEGIVGLELFSKGEALSGVSLRDKTATEIFFPHIATTSGWYTGIVAYNTVTASNSIEFIPYDTAGNRLTPSIFRNLGAKEKAVYDVAGMGLPAGTAWLRIAAQHPITGFELFGRDGDKLAGYTGVGIAKSTGIFPKIERNGGGTGIAFVNTNSASANVKLTAYNDAGRIIAQESMTLSPYQKIVDVAEEIFIQNISAATYIKYESDRKLVGFQINIAADNKQLDALPGL